MLKSRLSNGAYVYGYNRSGFGGRGIYIYRDELEPEFLHLEKFLDDKGVFVDVGANTGIFTLKAAKHYSEKGGTVVAVEPFVDVLSVLMKSVSANRFDNVRLCNFCASDRSGRAVLWKNFGKPNTFSLNRRDQNAESIPILTIALDDLLEWQEIDGLDFLKIDAEGAENEVLEGARKSIEKHRPIILMETTLADVPIDLADYLVYQAPGSPNQFCMPKEHPKCDVPAELGWKRIS